jgi:hypothetical protein
MSSLASEVKVANLALTGLGAERITSLTENSENARKVNSVFELLRDEVLRQHPWNFAIVRLSLAKLGTGPTFGFTNYFQIPGDVLRIFQPEQKDVKFKVEGDKVATNEGSFNCLGIKRITDATLWSTDFVTCFAARLEAELAFSIINSRTVAADKYTVYTAKLSAAKASDAQEGSPLEYEVDEWFQSREAGTNVPRAE